LAIAVGMRVTAARRTPSANAGVVSGDAWRAALRPIMSWSPSLPLRRPAE
jgi:hypothetical protein